LLQDGQNAKVGGEALVLFVDDGDFTDALLNNGGDIAMWYDQTRKRVEYRDTWKEFWKKNRLVEKPTPE
jgi:hypothetical protein